MMMKFVHTLLLTTSVFVFTSCASEIKNKNTDLPVTSHGKSAAPNYAVVFPTDKINRIDITIDKQLWEQMNADLKTNLKSNRRRPERPPQIVAAGGEKTDHKQFDGWHQSKIQSLDPGPIPRSAPPAESFEPIWTYCDVSFNNQQWSKVGIRYKGNSSLRTTYQRGLKKFSFKLDFDQFEGEFPEIKNQRFYGIKQLNLKNNFDDPSFIREKVASDLFAEFGLTSPKTSFCEVYVDSGEGPQYFGIYTLVEEVDDTVIKTQYTGKKGDLYKPEGFAATFAKDSFDKDSMHKKNNKKSDDFSDVKNLITVLNSSLRVENHEQWKTQLNEIFDVNIFLKWLAANEVMQNWDTYGNATHNYFLYNNTNSGKLEWIPWDNNEALQYGKRHGALPLSLNTVDENWPLIRYIVDDEEWNATYENYLSVFVKNIYNPEKMTRTIDKYKQLIKNSAVGSKGEQKHYSFLKSEVEFYEAIDFLKDHVSERQTIVNEFIGQQNSSR